jgi:ATP-binding cassette subfamily F protein uup
VEEYLERRAVDSGDLPVESAVPPVDSPDSTGGSPESTKAARGSAEEREARKVIARLDRRLERVAAQEDELNAAIAAAGQDYERLTELSAQLHGVAAEREALELEWLEAAELLE